MPEYYSHSQHYDDDEQEMRRYSCKNEIKLYFNTYFTSGEHLGDYWAEHSR